MNRITFTQNFCSVEIERTDINCHSFPIRGSIEFISSDLQIFVIHIKAVYRTTEICIRLIFELHNHTIWYRIAVCEDSRIFSRSFDLEFTFCACGNLDIRIFFNIHNSTCRIVPADHFIFDFTLKFVINLDDWSISRKVYGCSRCRRRYHCWYRRELKFKINSTKVNLVILKTYIDQLICIIDIGNGIDTVCRCLQAFQSLVFFCNEFIAHDVVSCRDVDTSLFCKVHKDRICHIRSIKICPVYQVKRNRNSRQISHCLT